MRGPDSLFKYMPEALFLANGMFRFTPLDALNDPFEARPTLAVGHYSAEDIAAARLRAHADGNGEIPQDELVALYLRSFPSRRMDEKSFPGLWPKTEPRLRDEPFDTLAEFDRALGERAIAVSEETANRSLGILCLTTKRDDESMWSYYGDEHRGVCIEFDPMHAFFTGRVRPVEYSADPIAVTINDGWVRLAGQTLSRNDVLDGHVPVLPALLIWRKTISYAHEAEWRMIDDLSKAAMTLSGQGRHAISLFSIPPEAIRSITFGLRVREDAISAAIVLIGRYPHWSHLRVMRRRWSSSGRREETIHSAD